MERALRLSAALAVLSLAALFGAPKWGLAQSPDHLVVMVFDQMRAEYIDRFDLRNFRRVRDHATEYRNAVVGAVPSVTVVSHAVINHGVPVRELPWQDNLFHDLEGLLGKPGAFYDTHHLTVDDFVRLGASLPSGRSVLDRFRKKFSGRTVVIGQKLYAAMAFGIPSADSIITLRKEEGRCIPDGVNVPESIAKPDRFRLDCENAYGTEASFYPIDGSRLLPGQDPAHLGGDVWTADAALKILEQGDWGALFLTFAGIDRAGHLWGDMDVERPHPFRSPLTFETAVRTADEQLGKILDALERRYLASKTMVVVTADHGVQSNRYYLGNSGGDISGAIERLKEPKHPPFWIERLSRFGPVKATVHDTAIRIWLRDEPRDDRRFVSAVAEISGVTRVFALENGAAGWRYRQVFVSAAEAASPESWGTRHDQLLVDALASQRAPTYIALLEDGVGFDLLGDHGGAQERVQRIPLFLSLPGSAKKATDAPVQLQDLNAMIVRAMGL